MSLFGRIRVTETTDAPTLAASPEGDAETGGARTKRRTAATGLTSMVLPELKALAATMGISGTGAMRKGDLIAAIQSGQSSAGAARNGRSAANGAATAAATAAPRAARSSRRPAADAASETATAAPDAAVDVQPSFDRSSSNGTSSNGTSSNGTSSNGTENHASETTADRESAAGRRLCPRPRRRPARSPGSEP